MAVPCGSCVPAQLVPVEIMPGGGRGVEQLEDLRHTARGLCFGKELWQTGWSLWKTHVKDSVLLKRD